MKFIKTWLILLGLLLIIPTLVGAEEKKGIQISPLTYDYQLRPGESVTGQVTVKNLNDTVLTYVCEKENFSNVSDEGAPSFGEAQEGLTALADWIDFPKDKEGTIEPGQDKKIDFTINVPLNAEPGGHYAAVFAKEIIKTADGRTELGVASRVGTLILVSVPGETVKTGLISEFISPKFIWQGPVDFNLKFKNTGTVHYDSTATVSLKSLIGKTSDIDLGTHTVLPQSNRNYEGTWDKKYPFGYYRVTATANDGNNLPITTTAVIWAIPLIIVIPVLIGLIILIIILIYTKRHYHIVKQ